MPKEFKSILNPKYGMAFSLDLVEVKGINLSLDQPMIYKIGTPKLKEQMIDLD